MSFHTQKSSIYWNVSFCLHNLTLFSLNTAISKYSMCSKLWFLFFPPKPVFPGRLKCAKGYRTNFWKFRNQGTLGVTVLGSVPWFFLCDTKFGILWNSRIWYSEVPSISFPPAQSFQYTHQPPGGIHLWSPISHHIWSVQADCRVPHVCLGVSYA